ncbi:hypothetical protein CHS0354_000530 [Potamilus streckersoni]|uniref:Adenosine 5'-phosphosulfate reductase n=1 Tax=Potamilus streckersoni TaxID=2493646 RepID=A0AAE0T6W2_9BIVA|nr:hypothetical protein CHS0354_000530 [Potamilus streckersoni]
MCAEIYKTTVDPWFLSDYLNKTVQTGYIFGIKFTPLSRTSLDTLVSRPMKTIGVVYPAFSLTEDIEKQGVSILVQRGFKVKIFKPQRPDWFFSGTDEERASTFTEAFLDEDVDVVIAGRGGYGSARMVEHIDWDKIKLHAKPFIGYSDITFLINFMSQTLDMANIYHGPMLINLSNGCTEYVDSTIKSLERIINSNLPDESNALLSPDSTIINSGVSTAPVVGGNLTLIEKTINTPYEIKFDGKILMIEDNDTQFYSLDRLLFHLKQSQVLRNLSGVLIGDFPFLPKTDHDINLVSIVHAIFKDSKIPVVTGFNIGHGKVNKSVRIGDFMTLDASKKKELMGKDELASLGWLSSTFRDKVVFSTSLGYEDQVITHMLFQNNVPIKVFTLDTGRMFKETYQLLDTMRSLYGKPISVFFPNTAAVEHLLTTKGAFSFYESVNNRKECCRIRKVEPLKRALANQAVWITGLRREQSAAREATPALEWDATNNIIKFHPLIHWTLPEVKLYIQNNQVPYNPLHDRNFPSIGCEPCTRATKEGEDFRSGRWWWEDQSKKECGLHEK